MRIACKDQYQSNSNSALLGVTQPVVTSKFRTISATWTSENLPTQPPSPLMEYEEDLPEPFRRRWR